MALLYLEGKGEIIVARDELWVERCLRGDPDAFGELVRRYEAYVFAIAFNFVSDPMDAQDIAQNVMLQVYRSLPSYQSHNFKAWIGRIAVNKSIDWKRRNSSRSEKELLTDNEEPFSCSSGQYDPEQRLFQKERRAEIQKVLEIMPSSYRRVIEDYYFREMSYQEIASQEGLGLRAIESRLYRAKHLFRQKWGEADEQAL